jgi:hypothetical protein
MTPATKKTIPLYQAGMPSTMVSSRPAMTLGPTEFADLTNVRNRYGVLEARKSDEAWSTTGLPTPTVFYGAWSGTIGGVEYALSAVKNETAVDIYDSADGHAWTNRSQSSGAYGNTKLDATKAEAVGITFQPIHDPVLKEAVLISDGSKTLIWQPTAYNSQRLKLVKSFDNLLSNQNNFRIVKGFPQSQPPFYFTGSDTGTAFTYVAGPTVVVNNPQGTADSGFATNYFEIEIPGGLDSLFGNQIGILVKVPSLGYDVLSSCALRIQNDTGTVVVYDPTDNDGPGSLTVEQFEDLPDLNADCLLYTYALPATAGILRKLRFGYQGTSTQFTADSIVILALVLGGTGPASIPNYAVTYFNSATGVESPPIVLDSSTATGQTLWNLFASSLYLGMTYSTPFPHSSVLKGNWTIADYSGRIVDGFDKLNLYRKDAGSSEYLFTSSRTNLTYSGSWGFVVSNYADVDDTKDETGLDSERPSPSVYNIAPPGFSCSAFANGRLFVGSKSEYQFSEYRFPMRCALSVDVDAFDRSGGGFRFASENPKAFFYLSGDANLDRIAIATDKATYSISGLDAYSIMRPGRISQFGTFSPKSFGTRRDVTFFLDDARHLRVVPGGDDLDKNSFAVKNILDGISTDRIGKTVGATFDDRYYLFYTPSDGDKNKHAFVFDLLSGTLTKDDYLDIGVNAAVTFKSKLLGFMSDGNIRQLETGTSNVTINISSREIGTDGDSWQAGRQRVYCDDTNSSVTLKWTGFKSGEFITDTISTNADGTDVRTDRLTSLGKSMRARSIQFAINGTVPGGTKFYHWSVEQEDRVSEGKA